MGAYGPPLSSTCGGLRGPFGPPGPFGPCWGPSAPSPLLPSSPQTTKIQWWFMYFHYTQILNVTKKRRFRRFWGSFRDFLDFLRHPKDAARSHGRNGIDHLSIGLTVWPWDWFYQNSDVTNGRTDGRTQQKFNIFAEWNIWYILLNIAEYCWLQQAISPKQLLQLR